MEKPINDSMTVRLGYLYDKSPVPDQSVGPLFPDANRNSFTVGASKTRGDKEYTFFYEAMFFENRVTNVAANANQYTNGDYHSFAHLFGLSLRFNLGDTITIKH
jgi:long-chain fatty acid transport protein